MNIQEYQKSAERTMNKELDRKMQLSIMVMGVAGEFGEVSELIRQPLPTWERQKEKIKDEIGDVFWYVANTCNELGKEFATLLPNRIDGFPTPQDAILEAPEYIGVFADTVKKYVGQKHELATVHVWYGLAQLMGVLCDLLEYYALTLEEVFAYNHEKRLKRYPEGFEAERSINRVEV